MTIRNRVFPLNITTLAPLHIDSGTRLVGDVDFYSDAAGNTTYVLNSDVALDLALQRWEASQPTDDEVLAKWEADLTDAEERLQRRRERNKREIAQFDENPPRDRRKREQEEARLVEEAQAIRARAAELKARRGNPPAANEAQGLPDKLIHNSGFSDLLKMEWVSLADMREGLVVNGRALVRYAYAGKPDVENQQAEIYDQIKDSADRPYIPGSSLKGALRSALAWAYAAELQEQAFQGLAQRRLKTADDRIEAALFHGQDGSGERRVGNDVLRDVWRAVHVGDSTPSSAGLELLTTQLYPKGVPIAVEAIPAAAELRATLQIERYLFEATEAQRVLTFGDWPNRLKPERIAAACRQRAAALIRGEIAFFGADAPEVGRFYAELEQRLEALDPRSFLLPVGWGAGWRSKTLDDRLRADPQREGEFARAVQEYKLKKDKSARFAAGDLFPATRKVIYSGNRPRLPLGWLQITIGEEVQR